MIKLSAFFGDRIQFNALLIVLSLASVLALSSQSAASYPTYLLVLAMLFRFGAWNDVFHVKYFWAILALVVYLVLSGFWSTPFNWREFVSAALRGLLVLPFVISVAECQARGHLRNWLGRSLALVASLAAIASMVLYFDSRGYQLGQALKGLGQLDNSIIAALTFGASLLIVLDLLILDRSILWRAIGGICIAVLMVAIYYCGSRNAWVSVTGGVGVYLLARYTRDLRIFVVAVSTFGLIFVLLLLATLLNEPTRDLLLPRGDSYRPAIWSAALEKVVAGNIWFGLGIGTSDEITASGLTFQHPHSIYLSVLFQGGIVGLSAFLVVIFWTMRELLVSYQEPDAKLAIGLLVIAITGYLLDGHELIDKVSDVWFLFWLPIGIALGLSWNKPGHQRPVCKLS